MQATKKASASRANAKVTKPRANGNATKVSVAPSKPNDLLLDLQGQVAAISKAQAVIEFNLDGTVITANENFLNRLGYRLDEIKGKHHSMFVGPLQSASPEYRYFWDKLNRGEYDAGQYKLIGKDGKDIWFQATYTPVLGADGRPSKIIGLATDVTALMADLDEARTELKVRTDIMNVTSIVSEADLKGDIVAINDKFVEISKYSKEELLGKPHNITRHPDMPKETFKALWSTIGRGDIFRGVIKNRAKDGTPYYVDAVIAPILGKNGKPRKYLGVRYDITQAEIDRQNMQGQLAGISKAMAVIEFKLDGTVITANENFLKTMGYTLDEIKGKHHSMFVEPSQSASPEYRYFWDKLNRGEYDAGQYKRIGKGGKEVWLQASYNPIVDEMGRPFKVVKYAADVTEQVMGINDMARVLGALAKGDLTETVTNDYVGSFKQVKLANAAVDQMNQTMAQIQEATESIRTASKEIAQGNTDLSQRTEEQASSLEEIASSMEELTSTVKQNTENAKQANQLAISASDVAVKGGSVVSQVVTTMSSINESSKKIVDIISVIDGIAFQTNILALNAAVEAARAGEQGRGFAVVATEVRNLAQRSAAAAKEIKTLIGDSVEKVRVGSKLVDEAGKTMEEIVGSVKRVTDIMSEITQASQEQSAGIEQVNQAITQLDEVTQQNAALVEQVAAAAGSLEEQAQSLSDLVAMFKLAEDSHYSGQRETQRAANLSRLPQANAPAKKPGAKPVAKPATATRRAAATGTDSSGGEWEEF